MRKLFTLVELLVTIAVIAVLSSLLLPALGSARAVATKSVCSSNLRQIYQATAMYVSDYNSYLPPPYYLCYYSGLLSSYTNQTGDIALSSGRLLCKKSPRGLYYCPATPEPASRSVCWTPGLVPLSYYAPSYMQTLKETSSSTNGQGAWSLYLTSGGLLTDRRIEQIKPDTALMGEQNYYLTTLDTANCCGSFLEARYTNRQLLWCAPAWNYHRKSANFFFYDGHVAAYNYTRAVLFDNDWLPLN